MFLQQLNAIEILWVAALKRVDINLSNVSESILLRSSYDLVISCIISVNQNFIYL